VKTSLDDKLFYRIGEVCQLTGVEAHILRSWEGEFPQLNPQKNRAGHRIYRSRDLALIRKIKELIYDRGFTLAGAKRQLSLSQRGESQELQLSAEQVKQEIHAVRDLLDQCVNLLDSL